MTNTPEDDGRTQRERMLDGDLYIADDPDLARESLRALDLTSRYNATPASEPERRRELLEELLGEFGEGAEIRPPFYCDYGHRIKIGARTFANFGFTVLDVAEVTVGEDVQIGPNVQLLTPTHPTDPELRRAKWEAAKPIVIEDNVWLGGSAIILPGVTVGENSIVGAGAVVTKDVPPNVVVVGNPARVIKEI